MYRFARRLPFRSITATLGHGVFSANRSARSRTTQWFSCTHRRLWERGRRRVGRNPPRRCFVTTQPHRPVDHIQHPDIVPFGHGLAKYAEFLILSDFVLSFVLAAWTQWPEEFRMYFYGLISYEVTKEENENEPFPRTALHIAAEINHVDLLKRHLKDRSQDYINAVDEDGCTALHVAAENGSVECLQLLLEASPECAWKQANDSCAGSMPVHLAVRKNRKECVEILMQLPYMGEATDSERHTAMHLASLFGYTECLLSILKLDPRSARLKDKGGHTPLHFSAALNLLECTQLLLIYSTYKNEVVFDVGAKSTTGITALHLAAANGSADCVELLLKFDKGLALATDKEGKKPIHMAAGNGHENVLEIFYQLIPHCATCKTRDGETPLHLAAGNGMLNCVKNLAGHAACDFTALDDKKQSPLYWAALNGHKDVVEFLVDFDPSILDTVDLRFLREISHRNQKMIGYIISRLTDSHIEHLRGDWEQVSDSNETHDMHWLLSPVLQRATEIMYGAWCKLFDNDYEGDVKHDFERILMKRRTRPEILRKAPESVQHLWRGLLPDSTESIREVYQWLAENLDWECWRRQDTNEQKICNEELQEVLKKVIAHSYSFALAHPEVAEICHKFIKAPAQKSQNALAREQQKLVQKEGLQPHNVTNCDQKIDNGEYFWIMNKLFQEHRLQEIVDSFGFQSLREDAIKTAVDYKNWDSSDHNSWPEPRVNQLKSHNELETYQPNIWDIPKAIDVAIIATIIVGHYVKGCLEDDVEMIKKANPSLEYLFRDPTAPPEESLTLDRYTSNKERINIAPVKKLERTRVKIERDNGDNPLGSIRDIVRFTYRAESTGEMEKFLDFFVSCDRDKFIVKRCKHTFEACDREQTSTSPSAVIHEIWNVLYRPGITFGDMVGTVTTEVEERWRVYEDVYKTKKETDIGSEWNDDAEKVVLTVPGNPKFVEAIERAKEENKGVSPYIWEAAKELICDPRHAAHPVALIIEMQIYLETFYKYRDLTHLHYEVLRAKDLRELAMDNARYAFNEELSYSART
eukprot:m.185833 g.185833  ORF g.185833 m.185833 type:complete len:1038 (+) comp15584_c0_seq3:475-3588(+)